MNTSAKRSKATAKKATPSVNKKCNKSEVKLRRMSREEFTPAMNSVGRAILELEQMTAEVRCSNQTDMSVFKICRRLDESLSDILELRAQYN